MDAETFGMFFCFLAITTDLATPLGCLTLSAVQFLNDDASTALGAIHRLTAPTPITIFFSCFAEYSHVRDYTPEGGRCSGSPGLFLEEWVFCANYQVGGTAIPF